MAAEPTWRHAGYAGTGLAFDYPTAFARTLGWITQSEQARLRNSRVAIAGLGGVGGSHLLTLARLGIGGFNLAEFDRFELHNFNRQAGAFLHTVGQPKMDVMAGMARAVNPELDLRLFPSGVAADNLDRFLDGVDVYVDGIDYFAFDIRRAVFAACRERGIPAVTAAPLGMGAALLVFMPGGIGFDDYFQLAGQPPRRTGAALSGRLGARVAARQLPCGPKPCALRRPGRAVYPDGVRAVRWRRRHRGSETAAAPRPRSRGAARPSFRCVPRQVGAYLAAGRQSQSTATIAARAGAPPPLQPIPVAGI